MKRKVLTVVIVLFVYLVIYASGILTPIESLVVFGKEIALPFSIPRWWDFLFIVLCCVLIFRDHKNEKELVNHLRAGLPIGGFLAVIAVCYPVISLMLSLSVVFWVYVLSEYSKFTTIISLIVGITVNFLVGLLFLISTTVFQNVLYKKIS